MIAIPPEYNVRTLRGLSLPVRQQVAAAVAALPWYKSNGSVSWRLWRTIRTLRVYPGNVVTMIRAFFNSDGLYKQVMRRVLITGTAGFIGFHLAQLLLEEGFIVQGYDALTDYYDIDLKKARHEKLARSNAFQAEIARLEDMELPACAS